ncbi:hypothetical protein [Micromonospora sp. DT31]|uniref:hypothetical protein n=1 Tax=Micromonospora sp. DT31 TaxID=3393434 RepID=UPI003CF33CEA
MATLMLGLTGYVLLSIPVFLVLMLFAGLTRSTRLRRAAEVLVLSACAALLVLVSERALEKPLLWAVAVMLVAVLVFGATRVVKTWRDTY